MQGVHARAGSRTQGPRSSGGIAVAEAPKDRCPWCRFQQVRPRKVATMPDAVVVDDHPNELRGLAELLESEGYASRGASSLEEARVQLAVGMPALLLLDVNLPDG